MLYFDHDTAAMGDPKLSELCIECGPGAVAAYWVALEQIYREETPLVVFGNRDGNRTLTKVVGHWLCTDPETLEGWFSTMVEIGLFELDAENPDAVTSKRATENIAAYREKRETARQNGKKGGRKPARKPSRNQRETESVTEKKPNPKLIKGKGKEKVLVTHKGLPNTVATSVAAADGSAPPAATRCPSCGSARVWRNTQSGMFNCSDCCESFGKGEVS